MPTRSIRHDRSRRLLDLVARRDTAPDEPRLPALRVSRLRDGQVLESQTVGIEASDDAAEAAFAVAATEPDTLVVLEYDMPTAKQVAHLSQAWDLHPLVVEDLLAGQRPNIVGQWSDELSEPARQLAAELLSHRSATVRAAARTALAERAEIPAEYPN